jgi:hypothetical protein
MAPRQASRKLTVEVSAPKHDPAPAAPPRCVRCGDVIGVYEWLVHVIEGAPRKTSRAAEPQLVSSCGACYHLGCYQDRPRTA